MYTLLHRLLTRTPVSWPTGTTLTSGGRYTFQDTLQAIAKAIHHSFEREKRAELSDLEGELWTKGRASIYTNHLSDRS